jgi:hypothetical protein
MNPSAIATEISGRLAALPGLIAAYAGPVKSVSTPCSVVGFPESINYHGTYSRGMNRVDDWPIMILTGLADDKEAFARIGQYAATSGAGSVISVLESDEPYTSCDTVIVKTCEFDVITWQKQDFQGAVFTLDVVGSGT